MQEGSSDALFPLDISYSEISQWLTNRRKLATDWIKHLREIQSRSSKALATLPRAFASQFESTEEGFVEYPAAKEIRDKLAETAERGYFGGLSGEAGVWDKIVKAYEKGHLFLGEAAQRIVQNVDYELPFLKKRTETLDKRAQELARRKSDCESNAVAAAAAFSKDCRELGIKGIELKTEIAALSDKIYEILQTGFAELQTEDVRKAAAFYGSVNEQLHGESGIVLPFLQQVFDNTIERLPQELFKEFRPRHDDKPTPLSQEKQKDTIHETEGDINWDVALEDVGEPEIQEGAGVQIEWEDDGDINWDIELEEADVSDSAPIVLCQADLNTQPVEGADATALDVTLLSDTPQSVLRFVWDTAFRNTLLDDLYELRSFLAVRKLADGTDAVSLTFADVLHRLDTSQIESHLSQVEALINVFDGDATQRFLMLKTSENYTERLVVGFQKKARQEQEWKKQALQAEQERKSVQTELSQVSVKMGHLARQTKELKLLAEQGISPLFNDRQINIMGKISAVVNNC